MEAITSKSAGAKQKLEQALQDEEEESLPSEEESARTAHVCPTCGRRKIIIYADGIEVNIGHMRIELFTMEARINSLKFMKLAGDKYGALREAFYSFSNQLATLDDRTADNSLLAMLEADNASINGPHGA